MRTAQEEVDTSEKSTYVIKIFVTARLSNLNSEQDDSDN